MSMGKFGIPKRSKCKNYICILKNFSLKRRVVLSKLFVAFSIEHSTKKIAAPLGLFFTFLLEVLRNWSNLLCRFFSLPSKKFWVVGVFFFSWNCPWRADLCASILQNKTIEALNNNYVWVSPLLKNQKWRIGISLPAIFFNNFRNALTYSYELKAKNFFAKV